MANIFGFGGTINGTADDDIIVDFATNSPTPTVINGGGGRDVIFGDFQDIPTPAFNPTGNDSFANASDINFAGGWTTASNPDIGDPSIPHTVVIDDGEAGTHAYYAVTVGAGQTITIDMDYGELFDGSFDGELVLFDSSETEVDRNDDILDADVPLEGLGSEDGTSSYDPYISYTNNTGSSQTYYIRVGQVNNQTLDLGDTYMLNISVTGHPAAFVPIEGNDTINGGDDDDVIYGMGGADTLNGDAGDDLIVGGTGADMINGGANDAGGDTASYADSSMGVNVQLFAATQSGGDAQGDVLTGIENLTGSAHNDVLGGDIGDNILRGGTGNDTLAGLAGIDQLFGEAGDDTFQVGVGGPAEVVAGETYNGGADNDRFDIAGNGTTILDFRDTTVTSVERINFRSDLGGGATVQFTAAQVTLNFDTFTASAHAGQNVIVDITMGTATSLDLSGIAISGFTEMGDGVVITGDTDAENIIGSSVNDTINGDGGDDTIEGGLGDDILNGGAGTMDRLSYANFQSLDGVTGITVNTGNSNSGTVDTGGAGMDTVSGFEILEGSGFNDTLGGNFDIIDGGDGDDTLLFLSGAGLPEFIGGEGIDTLDFSDPALGTNDHFIDLNNGYFSFEFDFPGSYDAAISGIENYNGSGGRDNVIGTAGVNVLNGNAGDDTLEGGLGADILNGGADTDTASYANSAAGVTVFTSGRSGRNGDAQGDKLDSIENIIGSNQQDQIILNADTAVDNTVNAGGGDDRIREKDGGTNVLNGEDGDDNIFGGTGSDTLNGGLNEDNLFGGQGEDILNGGMDDARDTLFGGSQDDILNGGGGNDALRGNSGEDVLNGGEGTDNLQGGGQNDILNGDGGVDTLDGGGGADTLNGGAGNDRLTGGSSNDLFIFENGSGIDRITDFNFGSGDQVDLTSFGIADFNALMALATESGGDVRIQLDGDDRLILENITIAELDANDFILV